MPQDWQSHNQFRTGSSVVSKCFGNVSAWQQWLTRTHQSDRYHPLLTVSFHTHFLLIITDTLLHSINALNAHTHTNQSERFWDPPLYQSQWVWRKIIMWIMFMSSRHLVWLQHASCPHGSQEAMSELLTSFSFVCSSIVMCTMAACQDQSGDLHRPAVPVYDI